MVDDKQKKRKKLLKQVIFCFNSIEDSVQSAGNLEIPIALGADELGNPIVTDLALCPNLLVGGQAGSGKTAFLDSVICSVLSSRKPDEVKLALVDLKGAEFPIYNGIPHLLCPVITDEKRVFGLLNDILMEIDRRLLLFSQLGVRRISEYNQKMGKLPRIVVIFQGRCSLQYLKSTREGGDKCGIHLCFHCKRTWSIRCIQGK